MAQPLYGLSLSRKNFSYRSEDVQKTNFRLTHEVLTSDPLFPACVFNRERQRLTGLHQTSIEIN